MVVTLDELGHVTCSYMGTDPPTLPHPPLRLEKWTMRLAHLNVVTKFR